MQPNETSKQISPTPALGVIRKLSERQDDENIDPPSKKRKVGFLGPGFEKYDATGLAPHYTHISQVPDQLKKCMCLYPSILWEV